MPRSFETRVQIRGPLLSFTLLRVPHIVRAEKVYRVNTFTSYTSNHTTHCSHLPFGMDIWRAFKRRVNSTTYKRSSRFQKGSTMFWCPTPAAAVNANDCTRNASEYLTENTCERSGGNGKIWFVLYPHIAYLISVSSQSISTDLKTAHSYLLWESSHQALRKKGGIREAVVVQILIYSLRQKTLHDLATGSLPSTRYAEQCHLRGAHGDIYNFQKYQWGAFALVHADVKAIALCAGRTIIFDHPRAKSRSYCVGSGFPGIVDFMRTSDQLYTR